MEATMTQPKRLVAKLSKVMGAMDWVKKRGVNKFHGYNYATESDIVDAVRERLAEAGIFITTSVESMEVKPTGRKTREGADIMLTLAKTKHTFHDGETGESLEVFGFGCGEDSGDKGIYKATTGAMKYFVSKNFLMSTGDDPENDGEEEKVDKQTGEVRPAQDFRPAPAVNGHTNGAPRPAAPRPPAVIGENVCRDFVKEIQSKSGPKKDGSTYTRYSIETRDNGFFTTFNPAFADLAMESKNKSEAVIIGFRANGRWKDMESIRLDNIPQEPPPMRYEEETLPF
jgi:hypothetical protein